MSHKYHLNKKTNPFPKTQVSIPPETSPNFGDAEAGPSLLARRALAAATVVLARAHVLRDKAVAARRVVEKLQDVGTAGESLVYHGLIMVNHGD